MMTILAGGILLMTFDLDCLIGRCREDTLASDALQQTMGTVLEMENNCDPCMYQNSWRMRLLINKGHLFIATGCHR